MFKNFTFFILFTITLTLQSYGQVLTLSYTQPQSFTVGNVVSVKPTTATNIVSYSISPTVLPSNLAFDSTNGEIKGTPTTVTATATYTITGTGAAAGGGAAPTVAASINITVNPPEPVVTYPNFNIFSVNTDIGNLQPTASGTPVTSYNIAPDHLPLPRGLVLDAATGIISGTPIDVSGQTEYVIRATAGPVHKDAKVTITVNDPGLPRITYNPLKNVFIYQNAIPVLAPNINGLPGAGGPPFSRYSITPDLKHLTGLDFDTATGTIQGTPGKIASSTNYIVTGVIAAGGSRSTNVQIEVVSPIPVSLYSQSIIACRIDTFLSVKPITGAGRYSVFTMAKSDEKRHFLWFKLADKEVFQKLPDGLTLNSQTGEISGTPTQTSYPKLYTISATDLDDSTQVTNFHINIAVNPYPDKIVIPPTISFVGQGNIQESLNSGAKPAANTGIGVVYRENSSRPYSFLHNITIDFSINIASTVDTIKSANTFLTTPIAATSPSNKNVNTVTNRADFGSSALLPLNSGQAFAFNFIGYFTNKGGENGNYRRNAAPKPLAKIVSGFNLSFAGSNRNWSYDSLTVINNGGTLTNRVVPSIFKTSLMSLYVGPFFEFITPSKVNNYGQNASITLGLGYSARWIFGDAGQATQKELRTNLLGSPQTRFDGWEISLGLRFYNIKAEVHVPFLSTKSNIPGLSGTQLTTFIGFSGGFPIDLTKRNSQ